MAIGASDVLRKLSINTGPGNSTAQGNVNDSIGGFMSSTQLTNASLSNLFDVITGPENQASDVEYRCFFLHNNHGSLTWEGVRVWIDSQQAGGASVAIGVDPAGVKTATSATAQAARATDENTAPAGVSFSTPADYNGGIVVGNIPAGSVIAIWVRRTAANSAALDLDNVIVAAQGDTAA